MENESIQQLLLNELRELRAQLDQVRTEDLPNMKTEMALLMKDARFSSKTQSALATFVAVVISTMLERFHRG